MAILLTIAEAMIRKLSFALTWWGFIFPLGAFCCRRTSLTWFGIRTGRILQPRKENHVAIRT